MSRINLISSLKYVYLKQNILKANSNFQNIEMETNTFPASDHYYRILNHEKTSGIIKYRVTITTLL